MSHWFMVKATTSKIIKAKKLMGRLPHIVMVSPEAVAIDIANPGEERWLQKIASNVGFDTTYLPAGPPKFIRYECGHEVIDSFSGKRHLARCKAYKRLIDNGTVTASRSYRADRTPSPKPAQLKNGEVKTIATIPGGMTNGWSIQSFIDSFKKTYDSAMKVAQDADSAIAALRMSQDAERMMKDLEFQMMEGRKALKVYLNASN
jgi:hypothetical protein